MQERTLCIVNIWDAYNINFFKSDINMSEAPKVDLEQQKVSSVDWK